MISCGEGSVKGTGLRVGERVGEVAEPQRSGTDASSELNNVIGSVLFPI